MRIRRCDDLDGDWATGVLGVRTICETGMKVSTEERFTCILDCVHWSVFDGAMCEVEINTQNGVTMRWKARASRWIYDELMLDQIEVLP